MEEEPLEPKGIYAEISTYFCDLLEAGTVPWHKPYTNGGMPSNLLSGIPYEGINRFYLASRGFDNATFVTKEEVEALGGSITGNMTGYPIFLSESLVAIGGKICIAIVSQETVYNVMQCNGIPPGLIPLVLPPINPIQLCREIYKNIPNKPKITHQGDVAHYRPDLDLLLMPIMKTFGGDIEAYYGTLFAQLITATGHPKRLNRKEITADGLSNPDLLALKELTAEIGAWNLISMCGIDVKRSPASNNYLETWIDRLKERPRLIVEASCRAQAAVDYILNVRHEGQIIPQLQLHTINPPIKHYRHEWN